MNSALLNNDDVYFLYVLATALEDDSLKVASRLRIIADKLKDNK